jgi:nephrocystin-4
MWGRPRAGQHPPSQLGKAKLHFVHETCAPLLRAGALIPEDFPVTYGDVVPGVLRFDSDG